MCYSQGIAGSLAAGLGLVGTDDWSGMIGVLKEELHESHSGGAEEGMIRASIKGLKGSAQEQANVRSLLLLFALVPEDTHCPLEVLLLRKRIFLRHLMLKTIILPRQAWDKQRESSKTTRFLGAIADVQCCPRRRLSSCYDDAHPEMVAHFGEPVTRPWHDRSAAASRPRSRFLCRPT